LGNIFVEKVPFSTGISELAIISDSRSPDLNPVDYKIWGVVQKRVYQSWVHSIDELKQRLLHVWHGMDQSIIDSADDKWRLRIRACVRARVDTTSTCCDIISMPIYTTM